MKTKKGLYEIAIEGSDEETAYYHVRSGTATLAAGAAMREFRGDFPDSKNPRVTRILEVAAPGTILEAP